MPTHNPHRQKLVSTVAGLTCWHPDDPRLPGLRTELVTLKLIEFITKEMTSAPLPLDADQRARITRAVYDNLGRG